MSTLSTRHRRRASPGETRPLDGRRTLNARAAGVDLGAHAILAGVPDGADQQLVRAVGTYPAVLEALADWCLARGIDTVAMASTGGDWMPLFVPLEARGLPCCLIRAQASTPVPGRKSAGLDGQGIHPLHRAGWFRAAWRPDADRGALRTLLRHRAQRIEPRAPHILPRHQALWPMNIQ